jgi:ribosomal-protein-alanine N-acetyltransferase
MLSNQTLSSEPIKASDLDAVMAIERASFAAPWSRNMFLEEMNNRAARVIIFKSNNTLVGYVCFWEVLDEAHLMNVAVHPDYRSRGYGKLIMEKLEAMCFQDGLRRIILEVGRRNIPARRLYRKCGFSAIGFRKKYYAEVKDDALIMEKWLGTEGIEQNAAQKTDAKFES